MTCKGQTQLYAARRTQSNQSKDARASCLGVCVCLSLCIYRRSAAGTRCQDITVQARLNKTLGLALDGVEGGSLFGYETVSTGSFDAPVL